MSRLLKTVLKEISSNKVRSFFMVLGVFVGISALTMVYSFGRGTQEGVMSEIDRAGMADTFTIRTFTGGGGMNQSDSGSESASSRKDAGFSLTLQDSQDMLISVAGIRDVVPIMTTRSEVRGGEGSLTDVSIQGVNSSFQVVRDWDVERGTFINDQDVVDGNRVAVIGQTVAGRLFPNEEPLGKELTINNISFEIISLLTTRGATGGGRDADEVIFIPISTYSRLFDSSELGTVTVQVEKAEEIEIVASSVEEFISSRYPGEEVDIRIPTVTTGTRREASNALSFYLTIVGLVSLLAGGLIIMNVTFLSVSERTAEIGLRKALGAKKSNILQQILLEVVVVSLIGGILGILGGSVAIKILTIQDVLRGTLRWETPVLALLFSLLIGLIFGLRPALRAASMEPAEALRSVE